MEVVFAPWGSALCLVALTSQPHVFGEMLTLQHTYCCDALLFKNKLHLVFGVKDCPGISRRLCLSMLSIKKSLTSFCENRFMWFLKSFKLLVLIEKFFPPFLLLSFSFYLHTSYFTLLSLPSFFHFVLLSAALLIPPLLALSLLLLLFLIFPCLYSFSCFLRSMPSSIISSSFFCHSSLLPGHLYLTGSCSDDYTRYLGKLKQSLWHH